MKSFDIAVIGGGPAGLKAAISAANIGARVVLIDDAEKLGGQLVKQTHMFFGSEEQQAGTRGIDIGNMLIKMISLFPNIEVMLTTTVLGLFDDGVITLEQAGNYKKTQAKKVIVATGASEKMILFPGNDLPGVYGAGAVQTLMNVHGVKPGDKVLMIGAGNIGLIVSYQLLQAGVEVVAIVEGSPHIGGYLVHAAKVRRAGVPILTGYTIKEARGFNKVQEAIICRLDENWNQVAETEKVLEVDTICLAVGLSPLSDLLWQADCSMVHVSALGGYVAWRDENLCTSRRDIFIAGDVAGVEEASSAMVEGELAGLLAAKSLGYGSDEIENQIISARRQLEGLRAGPMGEKLRRGLKLVQGREEGHAD
ncbi:MAG: NAD(P)/FAD-dependent oxidoreductase [bacterium]|nr:NAD(P)/FAD-dependent oxidoreductase [bacterium]